MRTAPYFSHKQHTKFPRSHRDHQEKIMKCGHCKTVGLAITVAHVRQCAKGGGVATLEQRVDQDIKDGNYRVHTPGPYRHSDSTPVAPNNTWAAVTRLRKQIFEHLAAKPSGKRVGYFAVPVVDDSGKATTKFYRVTQVVNGRVYVDAQASDEYWPVKSPSSLEMVLGAILADPKKASERYASELGRCYRCGRTLTDETSRSIGMGPECRSKH